MTCPTTSSESLDAEFDNDPETLDQGFILSGVV
jgi:hypothetical protein